MTDRKKKRRTNGLCSCFLLLRVGTHETTKLTRRRSLIGCGGGPYFRHDPFLQRRVYPRSNNAFLIPFVVCSGDKTREQMYLSFLLNCSWIDECGNESGVCSTSFLTLCVMLFFLFSNSCADSLRPSPPVCLVLMQRVKRERLKSIQLRRTGQKKELVFTRLQPLNQTGNFLSSFSVRGQCKCTLVEKTVP